jgi:hypothetical protein
MLVQTHDFTTIWPFKVTKIKMTKKLYLKNQELKEQGRIRSDDLSRGNLDSKENVWFNRREDWKGGQLVQGRCAPDIISLTLYWPLLPAACIRTLTTSVGWAARMASVPVVTPEPYQARSSHWLGSQCLKNSWFDCSGIALKLFKNVSQSSRWIRWVTGYIIRLAS